MNAFHSKTLYARILVPVITWLKVRFRVNFWNFWHFRTFLKITRVIYRKYRLNHTCGYWLITPNQQTLCIETNIFQRPEITNQWARNYKIAGNYKITPLTVQCWLQLIVWLIESLLHFTCIECLAYEIMV